MPKCKSKASISEMYSLKYQPSKWQHLLDFVWEDKSNYGLLQKHDLIYMKVFVQIQDKKERDTNTRDWNVT